MPTSEITIVDTAYTNFLSRQLDISIDFKKFLAIDTFCSFFIYERHEPQLSDSALRFMSQLINIGYVDGTAGSNASSRALLFQLLIKRIIRLSDTDSSIRFNVITNSVVMRNMATMYEQSSSRDVLFHFFAEHDLLESETDQIEGFYPLQSRYPDAYSARKIQSTQ